MKPERSDDKIPVTCGADVHEVLELFEELLIKGSVPARTWVLNNEEDRAKLEKILADIEQIGHASLSIANGDLLGELKTRGYITGSLKSLQSNLRHLTWQAQQIAGGDLTQHVDFLGDFSQSFNAMVGNLKKTMDERDRNEEALRQANRKLALLSGITRHDILNQLTVLKGYIELSYDHLRDPEHLRDFLDKEKKAADTIGHQILFTKNYQDMGISDPVWQGVRENVREATDSLPVQGVRVESDCPDIELFADPMFRQVFYNLIDNALRYGGGQLGVIRIFCRREEGNLVVSCENDGTGIPEEEKELIFRRGYGKNTGLGLFLVREILGITGMMIRETGQQGKGALFEITVPEGVYRTAKKTGPVAVEKRL
jgi:signal transduction histidine kinase